MIPIEISITKDTAGPAIEAQLKAADPHRVATRITVPITRHIRDNFRSLPHNKNSWPQVGFWESAARSTIGVAKGGDCIITVDALGVRQRLLGGQITARNVQNLAIPICAEAYGSTPKDFGDNLVLVILADGRKFLALWLGNDDAKSLYSKKLGLLTKTEEKRQSLRDAGWAEEDVIKAVKNPWQRSETTAKRVKQFRSSVGEQKKPKVIVFKGKGTGSSGVQIARAERHLSPNLKFLFVLKHSVNQAENPLVIPQDLQEFAIAQVREAVRA